MAITLEQLKLATQDKVVVGVINDIYKTNDILGVLPFDDTATLGGGGSLVYNYRRLKSGSTAEGRAVGSDYTSDNPIYESASTELSIFGGKFKVDRLVGDLNTFINFVSAYQAEKIEATSNKFSNTFINGDSVNVGEFDGLSKILTGSSTEIIADGDGLGAPLDLSTTTAVKENAEKFLELMDELNSSLIGKPDAYIVNSKTKSKFKQVGRALGYVTQSEDALGRTYDFYDGVPLFDLGDIRGAGPIVGIDATEGTTSIYAVKMGENDVHGVSLPGRVIRAYNPQMGEGEGADAIKEGAIEMVSGLAVKRENSAGVLRNIKVI